ncbi:MAG: ABC transporter ATP-binding protein [Cryobacterium sp.]|nr:ABC transporter ATP-binding protein [Cryobacterium sp.]
MTVQDAGVAVVAPVTVPDSAGVLRVDELGVSRVRHGVREPIVSGVGFELRPGETIGIVGESGSGKSLTAKSLIGLLPSNLQASGHVSFGGESLLDAGEARMRSIRGSVVSMVLQDPFTMLHPLHRVGQTIAESLPKTVRRDRARLRSEITLRLAEVGLDADVARLRTFELSGGMRQRVGIAAALAKDPAMLIADEPTTALDASVQREVLDLLAELQRARGMSLLLITHDLHVAFGVCDRIMVLYAGTMMELGPAEQLRSDPRHPYTRALIRATPPITHVLERFDSIEGQVPALSDVAEQCAFAARCAFAVEACRTARSPLVSVGDGHSVACIRQELVRSSLDMAPEGSGSFSLTPIETGGQVVARVAGLTKTFRGGSRATSARPALARVDFVIEPGESVGLVGGTGSGKSTIARCMMGLTTPDGGTIEIDGVDVSDFARLTAACRREVYRSVQMVFQDPYASLNPALTIGATLAEALGVRESGDVDVEGLLEQVGLPAAYQNRRPQALSGGERQRVAIARALAVKPRLLICDEPVAALDVSVQAQILELLRERQEALGMSMLFITHDLAVVRQMTSRLLVCHRGSIVESGATGAVLDEPQHPYTRALREAVA